MGSIKEQVLANALVDDSDGQQVLNFIAGEKVVTLEMIVERFPFLRWSDLFLMVRGFRRDGLVSVDQVGSVLEIRLENRPDDIV